MNYALTSGTKCTVCAGNEYGNGIICTACLTLDTNCMTCTDAATCTACDTGFNAVGKECVSAECVVSNCVECEASDGS